MEKKKIVLVLPRGEAIKNFVLSGTAALLRKQAHVTLISVIPNKEIELILKENSDVFYELEARRISPYIIYFWDWLDVVHGWWLWSGAAKMRWQVRDSEADTIGKKLKRIGKKIFAFPFKNRNGVELLSAIEPIAYNILNAEKYFKNLLAEINPDLVFNGSHIHSEIAKPVMHAARNLGIKSATFIFSWDNLTSQGRIMPAYNYYLVWSEHIKADMLKIYKKVLENQVFVTGTPQFDFHFDKDKLWARDQYCEKLGIDPARPILLYTTGMLNLMPGEEIIVERIADMCLASKHKPQLLVRLYPKDTSDRFNNLKARRKDICFPAIPWESKFSTPMPEDIVLYSNMLYHCSAGINIASTVSLELCMFDKPVINIGYNPFGVDIAPRDYAIYYQWEHYKPLTNSGALDIAWTESQMSEIIDNVIEHPEEKKDARKKLMSDFFGLYLDGKSYIRIADKLLSFAGVKAR